MKISFIRKEDFFIFGKIVIIMQFLVDPSSEGKTKWTVMRLQLLNQSNFVRHHTKVFSQVSFEVNWCVKSSILGNDELMMLRYFRVYALCEQVHVLAFVKPVLRTLVINLHMLGIVGPSPNFLRHFRAIAFVLELNLQ